jgi:hypothetical protein
MTTILIAAGVFSSGGGGGSSNVVTPSSRRLSFTPSASSVTASQQHDPTDVLDYELNLSGLLAEDEEFTSATIAVVPASSALGFGILTTPPYAPEEIDDSHIRIWVTVEAGSRGLSAWSGQGTLCSFEVTAVTNSEPPRTWQRTGSIRVAQK